MNRSYLIPASRARVEIVLKKSRFIASAAPAFSVEDARTFISSIRAEFPDAAHHVTAFIIGHGESMIAHCSDAGEPCGTAGRPALAVLQGSGLGDVVVVVTRYFGGIKLGTGGLVRAYQDAVKAVLAVLPRAQKCQIHTVVITLPYALFERARFLVAEHHGKTVDETFAAEVTMITQFRVEDYDRFKSALFEISTGKQVQVKIIDTGEKLFSLE